MKCNCGYDSSKSEKKFTAINVDCEFKKESGTWIPSNVNILVCPECKTLQLEE